MYSASVAVQGSYQVVQLLYQSSSVKTLGNLLEHREFSQSHPEKHYHTISYFLVMCTKYFQIYFFFIKIISLTKTKTKKPKNRTKHMGFYPNTRKNE